VTIDDALQPEHFGKVVSHYDEFLRGFSAQPLMVLRVALHGNQNLGVANLNQDGSIVRPQILISFRPEWLQSVAARQGRWIYAYVWVEEEGARPGWMPQLLRKTPDDQFLIVDLQRLPRALDVIIVEGEAMVAVQESVGIGHQASPLKMAGKHQASIPGDDSIDTVRGRSRLAQPWIVFCDRNNVSAWDDPVVCDTATLRRVVARFRVAADFLRQQGYDALNILTVPGEEIDDRWSGIDVAHDREQNPNGSPYNVAFYGYDDGGDTAGYYRPSVGTLHVWRGIAALLEIEGMLEKDTPEPDGPIMCHQPTTVLVHEIFHAVQSAIIPRIVAQEHRATEWIIESTASFYDRLYNHVRLSWWPDAFFLSQVRCGDRRAWHDVPLDATRKGTGNWADMAAYYNYQYFMRAVGGGSSPEISRRMRIFFDHLGRAPVAAPPNLYATVGHAILQTPFLKEIYNNRAYSDPGRSEAIKALRGSYVHALTQIRRADLQKEPCVGVELAFEASGREAIVVGATAGERNKLALPPMTHRCFKFVVKDDAFESEKNCVKLSLREVDHGGAEKLTGEHDVLQLLGEQGQGAAIAGLPNSHIYLRQRDLTADVFNLEPTPQSMSKRSYQIAAEFTASCEQPEPEPPAPNVCQENRIRCHLGVRTCVDYSAQAGITYRQIPWQRECYFELRVGGTWFMMAKCDGDGACSALDQDGVGFQPLPSFGPECSHLELDPERFSAEWAQIGVDPATGVTTHPNTVKQVGWARGNCSCTEDDATWAKYCGPDVYEHIAPGSVSMAKAGCAGDDRFCKIIGLGAKQP
jgi:hypothetical protein